MNKTFTLALFASLISALLSLGASTALAADPASVTGTGRTVIKRQPHLLRVQIPVNAEGKDIAEALTNMKAAQAATSKKLADLGAVESAIEFTPIQVGGGAPNDVQQQYLRMMAMRGNRAPKPSTGPQPIALSSTLKAEFALKAAEPDELLVTGYGLQEKIKAASASAGKKDKAMTPEEQESMEEAAAMQAANGGGVNATGPTFQYVSKISDEDQATALAAAFQKAKADAARLAKSAGAEIASLRNVSSTANSPTSGSPTDIQTYYQELMLRQLTGGAGPAAEPSTGEAISPNPTPVELQITVTAAFDLK